MVFLPTNSNRSREEVGNDFARWEVRGRSPPAPVRPHRRVQHANLSKHDFVSALPPPRCALQSLRLFLYPIGRRLECPVSRVSRATFEGDMSTYNIHGTDKEGGNGRMFVCSLSLVDGVSVKVRPKIVLTGREAHHSKISVSLVITHKHVPPTFFDFHSPTSKFISPKIFTFLTTVLLILDTINCFQLLRF